LSRKFIELHGGYDLLILIVEDDPKNLELVRDPL
jgi:hypothetical protein